jgi:hypothetical protein
VCGYCGDTFPISSDLKKHAENFHKISSATKEKIPDVENARKHTPNSSNIASSTNEGPAKSAQEIKGEEL